MDVREEVRFLEALCRVYGRSALTIERLFLPNGDPNRHRLDATVWATDGNHRRRVAIEFIKGFQGARLGRSSPAQNEVEAWRRLEDKIAAIFIDHSGIDGRCLECEIWLTEEIGDIQETLRAPRTKEDRRADMWMRRLADALAAPLHQALRDSLRTKRAEKASLPPELAGIIVHAQVNAYADRGRFVPGWPPAEPGVYVDIKGLVSLGESGQKVTTILPRWVGIDPTGIIEAVKGKLDGIGTYKAIARECGVEELWLVAVADGSSQMSMVTAPLLPGVKQGTRALRDRVTAKGRPFFDRVLFLAAGYWPPADLRALDSARNAGMSFAAFDLYG